MIVWINGAFGVGKSTTARLVPRIAPRARFWDPEQVGIMLRTVVSDIAVHDFQDWTAWRKVVVATGRAVVSQTGQDLVAPQTVLRPEYMREIVDGLAACSLPIFHVLLDAPIEVLRDRILHDSDKPASEWRIERLGEYESARNWMWEAADLVIDTTARSPDEVAKQIVNAAGLR